MTDMTASHGVGQQSAAGSPLEEFSAGAKPALRKSLELLGWLILALLIWTGITSIFGRAGFMLDNMGQEFTDPLAQINPFEGRYIANPVATWMHLIPGLIIFCLGPLQFVRFIRKNYIGFHRWSGRLWLTCGVIAAFSGSVIGVLDPFMDLTGQGFNESMATAFFGTYTLFCLIMAYSSIRQRKFGAHREWMIRSWALMLAIATERLMLGALMSTTNIGIEVLFGTTFWMAAVTNVGASEIWINLTRTPGNGARHWKDLDAKAQAG